MQTDPWKIMSDRSAKAAAAYQSPEVLAAAEAKRIAERKRYEHLSDTSPEETEDDSEDENETD